MNLKIKCPICSKVTSEKYKPFCSKRCADIDLYRWLNGSYAIKDEGDDVPNSNVNDVTTDESGDNDKIWLN